MAGAGPATAFWRGLLRGHWLLRSTRRSGWLGACLLALAAPLAQAEALWLDDAGRPRAATREAVRFAVARLIDRYLIDFSALGDAGHTRNEEILHSHLFTLANALGVPDPVGVRPERRFCRAMVVLSDSTPLGDTNANLPRFVWQETGAPIALGSGDRLSATPHRLTRVEVLERFYAQHPTALAVPVATVIPGRIPTTAARVSARADALLGVLRLGDPRGAWDVLALTRTYGLIHDPLPDPASLHPRLYQRAQVVLCEVTLGDVNSRTPRRARRTGSGGRTS